jgi:hypothetical protein
MDKGIVKQNPEHQSEVVGVTSVILVAGQYSRTTERH